MAEALGISPSYLNLIEWCYDHRIEGSVFRSASDWRVAG
jgi:hypothetical protein